MCGKGHEQSKPAVTFGILVKLFIAISLFVTLILLGVTLFFIHDKTDTLDRESWNGAYTFFDK